MEKLIVLLPMLISFLALNILYALFPYISRKTLSFGISIPENIFNNSKLSSIRKKYLNLIISSGIFFVAVIIILVLLPTINSNQAGISSAILVLGNLLANSLIYLRAHKQMKALKSENVWEQDASQLITVETGFHSRKIKTNPLWFAIYLLVITTTIMVSLMVYETIPGRIPLRFDFSGDATNFVEKSYQVLLFIPLVQLLMTLIFIFVYYSITKAKQQIEPGNRQQTLQQTVIFRYRWSLFTIIAGLLTLVMLSLIQFTMIGLIPSKMISMIILILPIIIVIAAVILSILTGQSGSRVKTKNLPEKKPIFKDDDSYWKFGVLYYNPEDPAIFIEKRFGIGWTINWGRKSSWLILLGLLLLTGGFILISFLLAG